jgi:hypothetical protein
MLRTDMHGDLRPYRGRKWVKNYVQACSYSGAMSFSAASMNFSTENGHYGTPALLSLYLKSTVRVYHEIKSKQIVHGWDIS